MKQRTRRHDWTAGREGGVVVSMDIDAPKTAHGVSKKDPLLELQLTMATSSINHEYARIEYDETPDRERREELLHYMDGCREKYLEAREQLSLMSPQTVERFEKDLFYQKQTTLSQYHA
ncbi:MAG: hypothetical protein HY543_12650 [Deltaproteobacteria bacterium]|nr:hypothetical protein [Deltaproteobacteria bacterium]